MAYCLDTQFSERTIELAHQCTALIHETTFGPDAIDMARERFNGEPRVSFARGEAASTGQPDASFDLVIAHTVYSHLVDPESALRATNLKFEQRFGAIEDALAARGKLPDEATLTRLGL